MDQTSARIEAIDFRSVFPWLALFRAFRIAIDLRKLLLAAAAMVVLAGVDSVLLSLLPVDEDGPVAAGQAPVAVRWPWDARLTVPAAFRASRSGPSWEAGAMLADAAAAITEPVTTACTIGREILAAGSTWTTLAVQWVRLLALLAVWSIFGGAITRIAAFQFARGHGIGLRAALGFSIGRFLAFLSAPLAPIAAIAALWIVCLVGGLLGRIPVAGEIVVGLLWLLPMVVSFVMALVLIGLVLGWPLSFATISVEGIDGLEGCSRSYHYLFSRPWYFAWLVAVGLTLGAILFVVLQIVATLVVSLSVVAVGSGMGDAAGSLLRFAPESFAVAGPGIDATGGGMGAVLAAFWLRLVAALVNGFAISYFWTFATIAFVLLRQREDATEIDEIYVSDDEVGDDGLPLVGSAASEQPTIERPVHPPEGREIGPGDTEEPR